MEDSQDMDEKIQKCLIHLFSLLKTADRKHYSAQFFDGLKTAYIAVDSWDDENPFHQTEEANRDMGAQNVISVIAEDS